MTLDDKEISILSSNVRNYQLSANGLKPVKLYNSQSRVIITISIYN